MDLTLLRSLVAIAEHGAVGDAASALGLSQPALSRRVRVLEEELGAELLEREGRGVALTEMGRLAVAEGRAMVARLERLQSDIARHVRLEAGTVRIGAGATAVGYLLPDAIASFQRRYPGVRFEVRESGSRAVERAVVAEELELGVITLPASTGELEARPLCTDRIVMIAGRAHPLLQRKRTRAADLDDQSVVAFEGGSQIRRLIDAALADAGIRLHVAMELRSVAAIVRMVEATGSLGFVSELGAPADRVVRVTGLSVRRRLALVHKAGRSLSPAAAAFAESLRR